MPNQFYSKFVNFLTKHKLYDEKYFKFLWDSSVFIDLRDDDYSYLIGGCAVVTDKNKYLVEIVPYMPILDSEKAVAIGIYTYVQALTQITRIDKKENYNLYFNYVLPLFYEKIYISENACEDLLEYEKNMHNNLLNDDFNLYSEVLNEVNSLFDSYKKYNLNEKQIARKARRLAATSKYIKKNS